ncbi:MAG: cysteine desulfurase [Dehalococcoidia bacterium]|nr:cysteine desulfurase [Dehalococcoidia bacterium]
MQQREPLFLDYNATTPIDPRVRDAMLPYLGEHYGNPSTGYSLGQRAREAVERARSQVASLIGATPEEIVFTSGGSESDNQAIVGVALANAHKGKHLITSRIEHPAVMNTCRYLEERLGFRITYLPVDEHGLLQPENVLQAITTNTILITVMHANNEVGTIEPIEEVGRMARERGIVFHTDAAQSCGKIPVDTDRLSVDLLTLAGHKMYAPKGIGALFIRSGTPIDSLIHGASQERGRRAGTENVPYVVGLGLACELAREELAEYGVRVRELRDRLHHIIVNGLGQARVHPNGHPERCLPNTLNISIRGISGEELLRQVPEIAASTGAACHAGSVEPSSVLLAMGLSRELALGTLRLTLGRWITAEDVDRAGALIVQRVKRFSVEGKR